MSDPLDFIVFDNVYHSGDSWGSSSGGGNNGCGVTAIIIAFLIIVMAIFEC